MKKHFFILFLIFTHSVFAQTTLEVKVVANNEDVLLGKPFRLADKTYQLDLIKFYITNLQFFSNGILTADLSTSSNLINLEDDSTRFIHISNLSAFDEIRFTFGVDSSTNVNGIMTGALDPVNGMYWTWQSGYINCKIEGSIVNENNKPIEYHLGGYLPDQLAAQQISLAVNSNTNLILEFHIDALLSGLSDKHLFQIMSPGENAVLASGLLSATIKVQTK